MPPRITVLRTVQRGILAFALIVSLPATMVVLVALGGDAPDSAVTGLAGVIVGLLGKPLADLIVAIASNPSDRAIEPVDENGDAT